MTDHESDISRTSKLVWLPQPILAVCGVCLLTGFLAGYFLRGSAPKSTAALSSASHTSTAVVQAASKPADAAPAVQQAPPKMPSLDDMKRMADTQAAPLLKKLESDPRNPQLENQIGLIYEKTHQFKQAAGYFEKSLQLDPKNVGVRADYASCLYYTGDVDGALAQLNQSLVYDPKHAGTLMNIGIIKWKGKNDIDGAVAAWSKILQYHPDFPQKDSLQHMIMQAKQMKTAKAGAGS